MLIDRVLGDRVLVQILDAPRMTRAGIVLPDRASHMQPRHGIVRSVGFLLTPEGDYRPCLRVNVGETVIVPPRGGLELDADGERLWVIDSGEILAVVKEGDNGGISPAGEVVVSN